jgi:MATE family multidrug resistance protein
MTSNLTLANFRDITAHKRILLLAIPMILSNITTPLIGMVDTAVLGHMQGSHFIAGAAIAALVITQLYWLCGFIRMSSTGLSAQALGQGSQTKAAKVLFQSLAVGVFMGLAIFALQSPILQLGLYFSEAKPVMANVVETYFRVRIMGAPAALANLALIGWLIGQQQTKQVLLIQVVANLLNAGLNVTLVFVFHMGVAGVAAASVCAEYFIFATSLMVALRVISGTKVRLNWFRLGQLSTLLKLNSHTFVRNLALQFCLAFLILQGAKAGQMTAATNAILMQFFTLIALGLDGIAFAVEALIGEAKGKSSQSGIAMVTLRGLFWSSIVALVYSLTFVLFGDNIIALLTDQTALQRLARDYLLIIWLLPVVAHWCFLLDGVFVGLTRAKAMQNSMLLSCVGVYFPTWWYFMEYGNWALWIAMLVFMLARGLSLGGYFSYLYQKGELAA